MTTTDVVYGAAVVETSNTSTEAVRPPVARDRLRVLASRADAVLFAGDGEPEPPSRLVERLRRLEAAGALEPDDYSLGGAVEALERRWAELLGKEAAIWLPTGTLANQLAVRRLCGDRPKVVLQEQSHLYLDEGDALARLSGISSLPLAPGRTAFSLAELERALDGAEGGRVRTPVGAVVIETPVRRQAGQVVPFEELVALTEACRARGVSTHLDAARLYMMSAAAGVPAVRYASLFDTVYVSLWKYFPAPFGAILAGQAEHIAGMYHERRMFGGGLPQAYLAAALALDGLDGVEERWIEVIRRGSELCARLCRIDGFEPRPFEHGSNIVPLRLADGVDAGRLIESLFAEGIGLPEPSAAAVAEGAVLMTFNPTLLRRPLEAVSASFERALTLAR